MTPELRKAFRTIPTDVMGELPRPVPIRDAFRALQEKDRFELTDTDRREEEQQGLLETGQFLVDRDGIVRWVNLDLAQNGVAALGRFPTPEELLQLARTHAG